MLKLIKGGEVYSPDNIGKKDILVTDSKICSISDNINADDFPVKIEVIEAEGNVVVPGFIDSHVHIAGGGGEGGFHTRTPAIKLGEITEAGVTTIIGCLGTDGVTRSGEDLLAKSRALNEEGITSYIYTGSYEFPVKTITGSIKRDIILIDEVIGVGEIAISDHRSSQPEIIEVKQAAAEARVGGMLSGKAGIVNLHLGDGESKMDYLEKIVEESEIPIKQFVPTHVNRNPELLERGIKYAKKGGLVDFTTSTTKSILEDGETKCSRALNYFLKQGVSIDNITFTSDGQGSLPEFDEHGNFTGLTTGKCKSLFREVRDAVLTEGIDLSDALKVITKNPARNLKLDNKGELVEGKDADIVILNKEELTIETVVARGKRMVENGKVIREGTFE